MGTDVERATDLVVELHSSGALSSTAAEALLASGNAPLEIGRGLGKTSYSPEQLLATILVDDSWSIDAHVQQISQGHARMLQALKSQESSTKTLVLTKALTAGVLSPYQELSAATPLHGELYGKHMLAPYTPLNSQMLQTLATVMSKTLESTKSGADLRTFTLIITDGADNPDRSKRGQSVAAAAVRSIVSDMLDYHANHIIACMGVGDGDWNAVFEQLGVPRKWIFPVGATVADLERVFADITARLALAASSRTGFRQLMAG